jgi:PAS domain S-box-containing protein
MSNFLRRIRLHAKVFGPTNRGLAQETVRQAIAVQETSSREPLPDHQAPPTQHIVKRAAALQGQESFIGQIAEAIPDIVYLYDILLQGCVYVNRQLAVTLGLTATDLEKMGTGLLQQLLHPDDCLRLADRIERFVTARDGDVIEAEYRLKHANGEWRWFHSLDTVFLRTVEGVPQQILGTARDITERKRMEEALRESETLAALDRMTSRLAHEINNPLASIKNALLLLRNAVPANHPDAKYLSLGEREIDRIARVIRQMPTLYRSSQERGQEV